MCVICENHLKTASPQQINCHQLGSSNSLPNYRSERRQDLHLAAVVHAAEGWWLLSRTQLVHTDWAVGSWARGGLGILYLQPRGDKQGLRVLHIALDQEIHIPPAVHEEVPSNITWDAQCILDLLYCLVHEHLRLLWTKCVPHWHLQHCHEKLFQPAYPRIQPDMEKCVMSLQGRHAHPSTSGDMHPYRYRQSVSSSSRDASGGLL